MRTFFKNLFKKKDPPFNTSPGSPWRMTEETLRTKYKIPIVEDIQCDLTEPRHINPIMTGRNQKKLQEYYYKQLKKEVKID